MDFSSHLPNDIILCVLEYLSPLELLRLRQVNKQLCALTKEHAVWLSLFNNSHLILPRISAVEQPTDVLERLTVKSLNVEACWEAGFLTPRRRRTSVDNETTNNSIYAIYLLQSRYLVAARPRRILIFDLEDDSEPFLSNPITFIDIGPSTGEFVPVDNYLSLSSVSHFAVNVFVQTGSGQSMVQLRIFEFMPLRCNKIIEIGTIPTEMNLRGRRIRPNFLLCTSNDTREMTHLIHLSSLRIYKLPSASPEKDGFGKAFHTEIFVTPKHALLIYTAMDGNYKSLFEVFSIDSPDAGIVSNPLSVVELSRCHFGFLHLNFNEPVLVHQSYPNQPDKAICFTLLVIVHHPVSSIRPVSLYLRPDGGIEFEVPSVIDGLPNGVMPYALDLVPSTGGCLAASLCGPRDPQIWLYKYSPAMNDGVGFVEAKAIGMHDKARVVSHMRFDGPTARLCLLLNHRIEVVEYV